LCRQVGASRTLADIFRKHGRSSQRGEKGARALPRQTGGLRSPSRSLGLGCLRVCNRCQDHRSIHPPGDFSSRRRDNRLSCPAMSAFGGKADMTRNGYRITFDNLPLSEPIFAGRHGAVPREIGDRRPAQGPLLFVLAHSPLLTNPTVGLLLDQTCPYGLGDYVTEQPSW
jgi:hypothetical protein